jgi:hypothetical protein
MKRHLKFLAGVAMLLSPIAAHAADLAVKAPAAPVQRLSTIGRVSMSA